MGVIADTEEDAFSKSLEVDPSSRSTSNRARLESELDIYYRYNLGRRIHDPLAFWIAMAKDPVCAFPTIAKLAISAF